MAAFEQRLVRVVVLELTEQVVAGVVVRSARLQRVTEDGERTGQAATFSARACRDVAAGSVEVGEVHQVKVQRWALQAAGWPC